ncbi:MAG: hypothetical protein AAGE84_11350 [Cyanobacteria bacterium P01_G01_bin.39]
MANKDFFLSADDAQTLGDINYMRKPVRVRHTFPKTLKNPNGFAVEKEISSSNGRNIDSFNNEVSENSSSFPSVQPIENNTSFEAVKSTPKKRPQGNSMDLFRNMARSIGKK